VEGMLRGERSTYQGDHDSTATGSP